MLHYYTGVGSRKTPADVLTYMTTVAAFLEQQELILRSGGALGADYAFERGVKDRHCGAVIYRAEDATPKSVDIASKIHPAWDRCSAYAKKLHARNVLQVLGPHCDHPSEFLICWTPDGKDVGGTRTALVLAREHGVPIYNLALLEARARLEIDLWATHGKPVFPIGD